MGWLIGEYWPWLLGAALLGALASAALTLRKVDVHTPPAAGSFAEEPQSYEEPEPEPEPEPRVDPIQVAARHFDRKDPQLPLDTPSDSGEFGPGSAQPLSDGSAPSRRFTVKANVNSMLFHTPESPYYGRTQAEVWFDSEETARAAGFARWDED